MSSTNTTAGYDPLTDPTLNHDDRGPVIIAIAVIFATLSSISLALRLYTRMGILRIAGWDDWTILITTILSVGVSVATILEVKYALGRHFEVMQYFPEDGVKQLKALYAVIIMYNFAMNVAKFSFLLQYRRIFRGKFVQRVCLWFMAYVTVWSIVQATVLGLACIPVSHFITSMEAKCLATLPVWYLSSAMNIVTDFAIFLIPLPVLAGLQLKKKQKLLVVGVFCLGFFTCIISIIRIFTLKSAVVSDDPTWDNAGAAIWTVVELNCAILCSCLPTLKPLLVKIIPGLSSAHSSTGYEMYYASGTGGGRRLRRPGASSSAAGGAGLSSTGGHGRGRSRHSAARAGSLGAASDVMRMGSSSHRTASSGSQEGLKDNAASYEYEKSGTTAIAYASKDSGLHGRHTDAGSDEDGRWSASPEGRGILVTTEMRIAEEKGRRRL